MKLTRRKLIQSLSAVLAAFTGLGRKSPTVGQTQQEQPRTGMDLAEGEPVTVYDVWFLGGDGIYRLIGREVAGEFIGCHPQLRIFNSFSMPREPRSKYSDWAEAAKPFDRIWTNARDVKRIEFEKS